MPASDQVIQLIFKRFDDVDDRLASQDRNYTERLDRQDRTLSSIERQTTLTNGRVDALEAVNTNKLQVAVTNEVNRRWYVETLIKLAPWVSCIITLIIAFKLR